VLAILEEFDKSSFWVCFSLVFKYLIREEVSDFANTHYGTSIFTTIISFISVTRLPNFIIYFIFQYPLKYSSKK